MRYGLSATSSEIQSRPIRSLASQPPKTNPGSGPGNPSGSRSNAARIVKRPGFAPLLALLVVLVAQLPHQSVRVVLLLLILGNRRLERRLLAAAVERWRARRLR
jgi:hypothetical protein